MGVLSPSNRSARMPRLPCDCREPVSAACMHAGLRRVTQKAFRTRKREREAAKEAQLRQLSARLASLELEKRALSARNALLERAVAASGVPALGRAPGNPGSSVPPASPCDLASSAAGCAVLQTFNKFVVEGSKRGCSWLLSIP